MPRLLRSGGTGWNRSPVGRYASGGSGFTSAIFLNSSGTMPMSGLGRAFRMSCCLSLLLFLMSPALALGLPLKKPFPGMNRLRMRNAAPKPTHVHKPTRSPFWSMKLLKSKSFIAMFAHSSRSGH